MGMVWKVGVAEDGAVEVWCGWMAGSGGRVMVVVGDELYWVRSGVKFDGGGAAVMWYWLGIGLGLKGERGMVWYWC